MELMLGIVSVVSVVLAVILGVVAWRLLRQDRDRSAARVEALEFEALSGGDEPNLEMRTSPVELALPRLLDGGIAGAEAPAYTEPVPVRFSTLDDDDNEGREEIVLPAYQPRRAAISDQMFGATLEAPARGRGIWRMVIAAAAMVVVAGGAIYAVRSADVIAEAGRRLTAPRLTAIEPLELLSIRHTADGGDQFTVTGLVHNPADGSSLDDLVAVVYLFDDEGRYFASGRGRIDSRPFRPGDESGFVVSIPTTERVSRYRVGFRSDDGAVVNHVDRRGHEPPGTSGDAITAVDQRRKTGD